MNTIYLKTKTQKKVKVFCEGKKTEAINFGLKLAQKNPDKNYFIITEDKKALKLNTQIII